MIQDKITSVDCWIIKLEDVWDYTIQITFEENTRTEKAIVDIFKDWTASGTGHDPRNKKTIHIYKKHFASKQKWNTFKKQFPFDVQLID